MNYYWSTEKGEKKTYEGSEKIEKSGQVELR